MCLWFNLYTTPAVMLFPELNTSLFIPLWVNEFAWLLEIARRLLFDSKGGKDQAELAIIYIRGSFLIDLMAVLPNCASGLDPKFVVLKALRLIHIRFLHQPFEILLRRIFRKRDK